MVVGKAESSPLPGNRHLPILSTYSPLSPALERLDGGIQDRDRIGPADIGEVAIEPT
jgi:hypothetical protein